MASLKGVPWGWLFPVTQLSGLSKVKAFSHHALPPWCVCLVTKLKGSRARRPWIATLSLGKAFFQLLLSSIGHNDSLPGRAQMELSPVHKAPQGGLGQFLHRKKPVWTGQNASLQVKGHSDVQLKISGAFCTLGKSLKGNLWLDKKRKLGLYRNYSVPLDYLVSDVSSKCRVLYSLLGGYLAVSIRGLVWWVNENITQYTI